MYVLPVKFRNSYEMNCTVLILYSSCIILNDKYLSYSINDLKKNNEKTGLQQNLYE